MSIKTSYLIAIILVLQAFFCVQLFIIWKLNSQLNEQKQQQEKLQVQKEEKNVTPGMIRGL